MLDIVARLLVAAAGLALTGMTLLSAIQTLVLPRSARDSITLGIFKVNRRIFDVLLRGATTYEQRDRVMALYAPATLLQLPLVWLTLLTLGYMLIFWALDVGTLYESFTLSGSSLLTLGFERHDSFEVMVVTFSEAAIGLIFIALLISYLPAMYSEFSRRETNVTMLEVRAGSPPTAVELLRRAHRISGLETLNTLWADWEVWFADLEQSHTSLAPLVFFRSPKATRSWLTAAGTVLDAAALHVSTLDQPRQPQADLCIRAGYIALRSIADFYRIPYDPDPRPDDPISISRVEFDAAYDELAAAGVPLLADRDQCWRGFAGWRVNYDAILLALAALTMAPYAQWVSDRSVPHRIRSDEGTSV